MKTIKTPEKIMIENNVAIYFEGETELKYGASIEKIIESMKAYASQFELDDEEIELKIREYYNSDFLKLSEVVIYDRIKGAMWYREQIKKMRK